MPKRVKHKRSSTRRSRDINEIAQKLVDLSTRAAENGGSSRVTVPKSVSHYMAEIGRKGGQIGGKQRLQTMSAEQRQAAAQKAAKARWGRQNELER
jgi:hypothetical protein